MAYPLAGWVGSRLGLGMALIALTALAIAGFIAVLVTWPAHDAEEVEHLHDDLPADHPHWQEHGGFAQGGHRHVFQIDALHRRWSG